MLLLVTLHFRYFCCLLIIAHNNFWGPSSFNLPLFPGVAGMEGFLVYCPVWNTAVLNHPRVLVWLQQEVLPSWWRMRWRSGAVKGLWLSQRQELLTSSWMFCLRLLSGLDLLPAVKGRSQCSVCLHSFFGWLFIGEDAMTKIHTHIHRAHHQPASSSSGKRPREEGHVCECRCKRLNRRYTKRSWSAGALEVPFETCNLNKYWV